MARKDEKPMLPEGPSFTPCISDGCRSPGRIWTRHLAANERICVQHYYRALEADPSIAWDDTVPGKMSGVQQKPVTVE